MADPSQGSRFRQSALTGTAVIGALAVFGLFSSYLRELTMAKSFGASRPLDLYLIALVVPQAIGLETANIAVASLLPRYAATLTSLGRLPRQLLHRDVRIWALALGGVALGIVLLAPMIAGVLGPGLTPVEHRAATRALRFLAVLAPLIGLSGLFRAWLDAQGRVWISAGVPALRPLGIVAAVAVAKALGAVSTDQVVLGVVCGAAVGLGLQMFGALHFSAAVADTSRHEDTEARGKGGLLILALGAALNQGAEFVDKPLASTVGPGQVAALSYATMILTIPNTVLAAAVSTVALPEFARLRFSPSLDAARLAVQRHARTLAVLALPVVALLVLDPTVVVRTLLGSRSLNAAALYTTATCVSALALGQFFYVLAVLFRQQLIAHQRYGVVVSIAAVSLTAKAVASVALVPSLGVVGLALGTAVSAVVAFGLFFTVMRRLHSPANAENSR